MSDRKFRVFFRLNTHYHNKSVEVIGDFNNWKSGVLFLNDEDGDNVWEGMAELTSGRYEYKFLVDGTDYRIDPENPLRTHHDNVENSVLLVGESRLTEDAVHHPAEDIDLFCDSVIILKIRFNKKKFGGAKLILTHHDNPKTVPGYVLYSDEVYSYSIFKFRAPGKVREFYYYFELQKREGGFNYLGAKGLSDSEWQAEGFEYHGSEEQCYQTPDWARDAVFYQIFPDRFFNANQLTDPPDVSKESVLPRFDTFYGGDLEGVIEKTGYLAELGVNAVYFNPLFESPSIHKYDTSDYRKIDPHFGTEETFRKMVENFRSRSIRFILDGVFNHTGNSFWAFRDIEKNGESSKYKDWYFIRKFPLIENGQPNYDCWWNFPSLPKLNVNHPEARKYLLETASYWIKKGALGWRLDVPNEIDHAFWKEFRKSVKDADPESYIVGEIWRDATPWLASGEFDSVMNYPLREACINYFGKGVWEAEDFVNEIGNLLFRYPTQSGFVLFNLLSSHDTARFFTVIQKNIRRLKLAVAFQFTFTGTPCIYYGEEVGLEGGKDPDNRRFMIWDKRRINREVFSFYKKIIRIRKENVLLRRGDIRFLYAKEKALCFERFEDDKKLTVLFNNSHKKTALTLADCLEKGNYSDLLSRRPLKWKKTYQLKPYECLILQRKDQREK